MQGSFGGINLEDIAAPRCFEIEERLKKELEIPVFHDDQHGTAIVVGAATINATRILNKEISSLKVVINGAGAAGIAIGKFLLAMGIEDVVMLNHSGIICRGEQYKNPAQSKIAEVTNKRCIKGTLADAMKGADMFVGVSVGNVLTEEMVKTMAKDPIVFALANPVPEINPELALRAGAKIVGTGSSRYPNQINNALVFPGLFRGVLDVRARDVTDEMMIAASHGIASAISDEELSPSCILPKAIDINAHKAVAKAVRGAAIDCGAARLKK